MKHHLSEVFRRGVGAEQEHDLGGNELNTSDRYFTHIEMVLPLTHRPLLRCHCRCHCCHHCCHCCHCHCHCRPPPRLPLQHLHLFSEYVR
jgi:hypothetical protein